eukprot:TRINITY_DN14538_c0_g1_i2.p1 TRINITY_DN14538_c0_g1~~TRINITY_DN14538_c0_g1_i2.p1  ORF type:complete len:177 (-),score=29.47 TRINITY_DN14538_c0_g1_i2:165-695(-)
MLSATVRSVDFSTLPFGKLSRTLPIPKFLQSLPNEDDSNRTPSESSVPLKKSIKKSFGRRNLKRSHKIDKGKLEEAGMKFGRWDMEEHERFLEAMGMFGNSWKLVREYVRTRTEDQIRSHAQKHYEGMLNKEIKRIKETPGDNRIFAVTRVYYYTNGVSTSSLKKSVNSHNVKKNN